MRTANNIATKLKNTLYAIPALHYKLELVYKRYFRMKYKVDTSLPIMVKESNNSYPYIGMFSVDKYGNPRVGDRMIYGLPNVKHMCNIHPVILDRLVSVIDGMSPVEFRSRYVGRSKFIWLRSKVEDGFQVFYTILIGGKYEISTWDHSIAVDIYDNVLPNLKSVKAFAKKHKIIYKKLGVE